MAWSTDNQYGGDGNFDAFEQSDLNDLVQSYPRFGQAAASLVQPQAQDKTALQCLYDFAT